MRSLFFLCELHAVHVFDVTNNIRASLINGGRLINIDGSILISLQLVSGCYLRLSLFHLLLLLQFHELLEGAFELNLAPLALLRYRLRTLLQQVDCPSLLLYAQVKIVLAC